MKRKLVVFLFLFFVVITTSGCLSWLGSGLTQTSDFIGLTDPQRQGEVAEAIVGVATSSGNPLIIAGASILTGLLSIAGVAYRRRLLKTQPPKD